MKLCNSVAAVALCAAGAAAGSLPPITPANSIQCMNYASTPIPVHVTPFLEKPEDVVVDGDGDIFVVDQVRGELIRIGAGTGASAVLLGRPYLQRPMGVAISLVHADLYVGDVNTSTIWKLACQTSNKRSCQKYHSTPLNISIPTKVHPQGLQMDAEENLYIADFANHRVLRRDGTSGNITTLLSEGNMGAYAPSKPFGPHDIALDPVFHELFVTDITNDDLWSIKCLTPNANNNACDQYAPHPGRMELTGSSSNIESPSGIVTDEQLTLFVTGQKNGIVAEIKGNKSVDLLQEGTPGYLKDPVALAYDERPQNKSLYITDDPTGSTDRSQGLYRLPCLNYACIALDERYIKNVKTGTCGGYAVGSVCSVQCSAGHYSPNATHVTCSPTGWEAQNIDCIPNSAPGSVTTPVPSPTTGDGVGVAVGVTLAILVVLAVAIFLVIRHRQGRLIVKTSGGDYSSTFGSSGI